MNCPICKKINGPNLDCFTCSFCQILVHTSCAINGINHQKSRLYKSLPQPFSYVCKSCRECGKFVYEIELLNEKLNKKYDEASETIASLESHIAKLTSEKIDQKEVRIIHEENERLRTELVSTHEAMNTLNASFKLQLSNTVDEKKYLEKIDKISKENAQLSTELSNANQRMNSLQSEFTLLNLQHDNTNKTVLRTHCGKSLQVDTAKELQDDIINNSSAKDKQTQIKVKSSAKEVITPTSKKKTYETTTASINFSRNHERTKQTVNIVDELTSTKVSKSEVFRKRILDLCYEFDTLREKEDFTGNNASQKLTYAQVLSKLPRNQSHSSADTSQRQTIATPLIKITRLPEAELSKDEIIDELKKGNDWLRDAPIEVISSYIVYSNNEKYRNIIVKTDLHHQALFCSKGILNMLSSIIRCGEYLNLLQCFKCNQYGHRAIECKNEICCRKCTGKHHHRTCHATRDELKCMNCIRMNNVQTCHAATYDKCEARRTRINLLSSKCSL